MQNPDINKVVRQHVEMEQFFTGGFTVKTQSTKYQQKKTGRQIHSSVRELETIAEQVGRCRKCPLGSLRTNAVPGEGSPAARIMFVGEGPGADEDAQGRPFVGRAGQLLDRIITAMGLKRSDVYIAAGKQRPEAGRDNQLSSVPAKTNRDYKSGDYCCARRSRRKDAA